MGFFSSALSLHYLEFIIFSKSNQVSSPNPNLVSTPEPLALNFSSTFSYLAQLLSNSFSKLRVQLSTYATPKLNSKIQTTSIQEKKIG